MERRYLLSIFSILTVLIGLSQEATKDSVASVNTRIIQPAFYIDYGKLLTIPTSFETKYEGGVELTFFEHFPLILEIGQATLSPEGAFSNGIYESEGFYYRIGAGFVNQFSPKNKIGVSVRYSAAVFSESGRITIQSPSGVQETFTQTIENENLDANWYEIVVYSDRKLSDLFSIGLNIRLKVLASYEEQNPIDVYAIPGYGRSFENTVPAANLFLKITF
ncbi:MAG: DUF6048 family protein [Bacteroidota bacterium]